MKWTMKKIPNHKHHWVIRDEKGCLVADIFDNKHAAILKELLKACNII